MEEDWRKITTSELLQQNKLLWGDSVDYGDKIYVDPTCKGVSIVLTNLRSNDNPHGFIVDDTPHVTTKGPFFVWDDTIIKIVTRAYATKFSQS